MSRTIQSYQGCYAFPQLGDGNEFGLFRLGGTGLSNMLFTWARCLVLARRYGLQRIREPLKIAEL
jgi:hypothetical protein